MVIEVVVDWTTLILLFCGPLFPGIVYCFTGVGRLCSHFIHFFKSKMYRIYSINRPGPLLNFWTLRVGAYKIFTLFNNCSIYILQQNSKFCNKTRSCNKARFVQNILKKTPSSGKFLISTYSFSFWGGRRKWVGLIWVWAGVGGRWCWVVVGAY